MNKYYSQLTLQVATSSYESQTFAQKICKGLRLKVFSVKKATSEPGNTANFPLLKTFLAKYDVYLQIHSMKGLKCKESKTVYRCIEVLNQEGWIAQK